MQRLTFVHRGEQRSIALADVVAVIDAPRLRRLPRASVALLDTGDRIVATIGTGGRVALIVSAGKVQFALLAERVGELVEDAGDDWTLLDPRLELVRISGSYHELETREIEESQPLLDGTQPSGPVAEGVSFRR